MDDIVLGAIAALQPTASVKAIQDHIASRGMTSPSCGEVAEIIDRLIGCHEVRPKVEVEDCGRWPRRIVYYRTVEHRC